MADFPHTITKEGNNQLILLQFWKHQDLERATKNLFQDGPIFRSKLVSCFIDKVKNRNTVGINKTKNYSYTVLYIEDDCHKNPRYCLHASQDLLKHSITPTDSQISKMYDHFIIALSRLGYKIRAN